jgi:hypothetical protein
VTEPAASAPETPADVRPRGVSRASWRRVITWARAGDFLLEGLALGLAVAAAVGFASYTGRRVLVGELAEEYLRRRGVESEIEVLDVDARGFVGRVRLGPAADPDFAAERVEVLLEAPPPPEGPYALRPRSIVIRRPQLKARWTGERLSFGALDPIVEEALARPPEDDRPGPLVRVEDGFLRLATPYGLIRAGGSALVDDGELRSLDLATRPVRLAGEGFAADLGAGAVRLRVSDAAADVQAEFAVSEASNGTVEVEGAVVRLTGRAPYPDIKNKRLDGPLRLNLGLRAQGATGAGADVMGPELNLDLRGQVAGPWSRLAYAGRANAAFRAERLSKGDLRAGGVRAEASLLDAELELGEGGVVGQAALRTVAAAEDASSGAVRLQTVQGALSSARVAFSSADGRLSGPVRFSISAAGLRSGELSARAVEAEGASAGAALRLTGDRLDVLGPLNARVRARTAALGGQGTASGLDAVVATELRLLTGGSVAIRGTLAAERLQLAAADPVTFSDARARFGGRGGVGGLDVRADLRTDAALPPAAARRIAKGLPVLGDSPAYAAAVGRALSGFTLTASDVRLTQRAGRTRLAFAAPVEARATDGARVVITPEGGGLVLGPTGLQGGAMRVAFSGGGLPEMSASIADLRFAPSGVSADVRLRAALDIPLAVGAVVDARGRASSRSGAFTFTAAECVRVQAARVELGENDVEAVAAQLCPTPGAPAIQTGPDGYRIRGRFAGAAAVVPFLQAKLSAGEGVLDARGGPAGLTGVEVQLRSAEATDTAPERRFHPAALTGTAALAQGNWRAALDILDGPGGTEVAAAALLHDTRSGGGHVDIVADDLRFTPEGLQPHDLSPLAAGLVSKVDGRVDFTGRIAWTQGALPTSAGRFTTADLSLDSPAGRVVGLAGTVDFNSLTPLLAPAGQVLTAERVESFTPLTDVRAEFALTAEAVELGSATFVLAGGRAAVEPMSLPFAEPRTLVGAVRLDDVDLGSLIAATSFADKVKLQAVVDGRIPFRMAPDGLRFAGGELRSVRPGRLSIAREALTQVSATGAPEALAGAEGAPAAAPPPNAFQDWAYQALENLAYNQLEVSVDSRPEGRLGLVFSVKGRHDPPTPQQARIGLLDLLRGRAFQRKIPLPSDTPVNLTLDTSLNFDELLATYLDLQRERSAPVQSAPAIQEQEDRSPP